MMLDAARRLLKVVDVQEKMACTLREGFTPTQSGLGDRIDNVDLFVTILQCSRWR